MAPPIDPPFCCSCLFLLAWFCVAWLLSQPVQTQKTKKNIGKTKNNKISAKGWPKALGRALLTPRGPTSLAPLNQPGSELVLHKVRHVDRSLDKGLGHLNAHQQGNLPFHETPHVRALSGRVFVSTDGSPQPACSSGPCRKAQQGPQPLRRGSPGPHRSRRPLQACHRTQSRPAYEFRSLNPASVRTPLNLTAPRH